MDAPFTIRVADRIYESARDYVAAGPGDVLDEAVTINNVLIRDVTWRDILDAYRKELTTLVKESC
jgi:hypothetical protein